MFENLTAVNNTNASISTKVRSQAATQPSRGNHAAITSPPRSHHTTITQPSLASPLSSQVRFNDTSFLNADPFKQNIFNDPLNENLHDD